jgi:hypothetical protein
MMEDSTGLGEHLLLCISILAKKFSLGGCEGKRIQAAPNNVHCKDPQVIEALRLPCEAKEA